MVRKVIIAITTIINMMLGLHSWNDPTKEEVPSRDWIKPIRYGPRGIVKRKRK